MLTTYTNKAKLKNLLDQMEAANSGSEPFAPESHKRNLVVDLLSNHTSAIHLLA